MNYYLGNVWDYILPDGNRFCHWGGKNLSRRIIEILDVNPNERVLDVCCGEAGTLIFLSSNKSQLYGVDISFLALQKASIRLKKGNNVGLVNLVEADASEMPFESDCFDKIFAQDPDSFLHPNKCRLMEEIGRVAKTGAKFIFQSYVETRDMDQIARTKTSKILTKFGYPHSYLLCRHNIPNLFSRSGFCIESIESLHSTYARDNLRMIANTEKYKDKIEGLVGLERFNRILELLKWEQYLFSKKLWTGVIVVAIKDVK